LSHFSIIISLISTHKQILLALILILCITLLSSKQTSTIFHALFSTGLPDHILTSCNLSPTSNQGYLLNFLRLLIAFRISSQLITSNSKTIHNLALDHFSNLIITHNPPLLEFALNLCLNSFSPTLVSFFA
jgi:hypothetical protein